MNKRFLIFEYFQKKDQLTVQDQEYQQTISSFFAWLIDNDKVKDDRTTKYFPNITCQANIIAKQEGIIAGVEEIDYLLQKFTPLSFKSLINDGSQFKNGEVIAEIKGKSHEILGYERTILNILQRMSGIAAETNYLVNLINRHLTTDNRQPFLAATRKTPWMNLDKKAVAVGGGLTHRLNLSDGILIKDNHLANVTIEKALEFFLKRSNPARRGSTSKELIEIEVENEKQARDAIKIFQKLTTHNSQPITHNHLAILLDNFTPQKAKQTLINLKKEFDLSAIIFEASGGIDKNNIKDWSQTGVDILSLGSLTHSTRAANLSLEIIY